MYDVGRAFYAQRPDFPGNCDDLSQFNLIDHSPDTSDEPPDITRHVWKVARHVPDMTRDVSKVTRDVPDMTRDVPKKTRDVPSMTRDVSEVTRDLPDMARDVPEETRDLREITGTPVTHSGSPGSPICASGGHPVRR